MKDPKVKKLIEAEKKRQKGVINLIASENYVSKDVLEALGSELTNKYAEGYPGGRYYGGNEIIDQVENLCKQRALKLFNLKNDWSVNVQALSGSPANLAVYVALAKPGSTIMGMSLDHGGHLTHGHKVSVTGKLWKQVAYGVDKETELIDYDEVKRIAQKEKPEIIVAGYTAYSRAIDWKKFREIADSIKHSEAGKKTYLLADVSHTAGLIAAGVVDSPFPYADVVTMTTHKTLRGPRAALIFSKNTVYAKNAKGEDKPIGDLLDKAVFPGLQGGPHMNTIAATAVALEEASKPAFKKYAKQILKNTKAMANEFQKLGWRVVSGGTDTHLFLVDTVSQGVPGKIAGDILEKNKIVVNKNTIPYDTRSPQDPSGIRIGTAAETTRGKKEKYFINIARKIDKILKSAKSYDIKNKKSS